MYLRVIFDTQWYIQYITVTHTYLILSKTAINAMSSSTRRSTRTANKKVSYGHDVNNGPDPDGEHPVKKHAQSKPSGSKAQLAKRNSRGQRGSLSQLTDFPLDVLFEVNVVLFFVSSTILRQVQIFGHLDPHDLLRLSRTTKELRKLLLQTSNAFIWRNARATVDGLPDIPQDMSEPFFAHLCYDSVCHVNILSLEAVTVFILDRTVARLTFAVFFG